MAVVTIRSSTADRQLVASDNNVSNAINATTANAGVENVTTSGARAASHEYFAPTYYVGRGCYVFDTSSLPDDAVISSVVLGFNFTGLNTTETNNYSVNCFLFTPATPGTIVANDFDEAKGTAACDTPKDITGLTGDSQFTLNATGIAGINKTGYTHFSLRLSGDSGGATPTGPQQLNGYPGGNGTESNRPYLTITYTVPDSGLGVIII